MTQSVTGVAHGTHGTHGTPAGPGAGGDPGFTAAVSAITDAFGDPTRRRIYLFVREHTGDAIEQHPDDAQQPGHGGPGTSPAPGQGDPGTQQAPGLRGPGTQQAPGLRGPGTQQASGLRGPGTQQASGLRGPGTQQASGLRGPGTQQYGVTASAVAAAVGVHPNVARHHLDKLAAGGYIEVGARPVGDGSGRRAGRPSKHYVAVPVETASKLPPVRSDDLVLALLGQALARLPQRDAEAMAEEVGATYGQQLAAGLTGDALVAGQRSLRSAMQSVAAALTAHGFAARTGAGDKLRIINDHCPFGNLAVDHPVLCAVDRGLVRGMLTALYPAGVTLDIATESSKARGDAICTTAV